jgi:hypothetical protein
VFRSPPGLGLRSIGFESNSIESRHSIDIESAEDTFDSMRIYRTRISWRSIRCESTGGTFDSIRICGRCVRFDRFVRCPCLVEIISFTTVHHSLGGQVQKMRGTANATLIAVEIELCGKCFHRRAVVRSVIKRTITESEAQ